MRERYSVYEVASEYEEYILDGCNPSRSLNHLAKFDDSDHNIWAFCHYTKKASECHLIQMAKAVYEIYRANRHLGRFNSRKTFVDFYATYEDGAIQKEIQFLSEDDDGNLNARFIIRKYGEENYYFRDFNQEEDPTTESSWADVLEYFYAHEFGEDL